MVPQTYDAAMKRILADEGGYSNDAGDPGGPTRYGITIFDVRKYLKAGATAEDVKAISVSDAMLIYRKHYAAPSRYDDLPAGLDYTVLDYGINSGVGRSGKVLRRLVGLPTDTNVINDEVLRAVAKRDAKSIIVAMNEERLQFLQSLKIWPTFGKGWGRRVAGVKAASLQMFGIGVDQPLPAPLPTPGKGKIPEPTGAKNTIKVGVPSAGAAAGASLWDWLAAHPAVAVAISVGLVIGAAFLIAKITQWHKTKSEEPMPGLVPVPELPAA